MTRRLVASLGLALLVAVGCKRPFDEAGALVRGHAAVEPFKKELNATLLTAMAKGPLNAVDVCSVEAPAIAARTAAPNVRLGRASSRLRNGTNAPPSWVAPLVAELETKKAEGGTTRVVELPNDRLGYVSAISIGPVCLSCHGTAIDPAVKARLDEKYPHDRATGYAVGDFRGVFWAELPAR
jgi:hypothetical protein